MSPEADELTQEILRQCPYTNPAMRAAYMAGAIAATKVAARYAGLVEARMPEEAH